MNSHLGLRDIQGLDPISGWPLALGWWIVIGGVLALVALAVGIALWRQRRKRRWEFQLRTKLDQMAKGLDQETAQPVATELAEMVRRLALYRFSRKECAHLQGIAWLQWLSHKDPAKYDWMQSSSVLIEAPYRPPGLALDVAILRKTISAAKGWVT
jgi:hypothetical protein